MNETIGVVVTGACGRMGAQTVSAVRGAAGMRLAGAVDPSRIGKDIGEFCGGEPMGIHVVSTLADALAGTTAHVLVDFTRGDVAPALIEQGLDAGLHCVTGTTGIAGDALEELKEKAGRKELGLLIAPNFALGAVLMMDFARRAARHYEYCEIIELHHENKLDAPSGTAMRTAELMLAERSFRDVTTHKEKLPHIRGGDMGGIRIHSVRLPGLLAHQEVILGGTGETLIIRHDSTSRESFMPGVLLAIRRIGEIKGAVVGLEHLLD